MKKLMLAMLMLMLSLGFLNAASISGNCTTLDGEALSDISIMVIDNENFNGMPMYFGISDEDGNFTIDVELGNYIAAALSPARMLYFDNVIDPAEATIIEVTEENPDITGIDFAFENYYYEGDGIISGNVVNDSGEPIVQAFIDVIGIESFSFYTGITDNNGDFTIEGIVPGEYYLSVWAYGYPAYYFENASCPEEATILVIEEETTIEGLEIVLIEPETFEVTGIVLDADTGNPIENVEIWAMISWERNDVPQREELSFTDENGEFTLEVIAGDYYFMAYSEYYNPQFYDHQESWLEADIVTINSNTENINFDLTIIPVYENSFFGIVTTEDGEPVQDALIFLLEDWAGFWIPVFDDFGMTDENGEYLIENIEPSECIVGCFSFWGMLPMYYENTYNLEEAFVFNVLEDSNFEANFTLIEPEIYTISGVVLDDETGNPVVGAEIWAMGGFNIFPRDWDTEPFGTTDENGEFTLSVIEGEYWIECWSYDYYPQWFDHKNDFSEADVIEVNEDLENINFDLIAYETYENTISGTVLIDGEVPEEEVFICAYSEDSWYSGIAFTDENGNYIIENLPPFEYYIQAHSFFTAPMFYDNVYDFEEATAVYAEGAVTGIDFNLETIDREGLITLSGIISDFDGEPVVNSSVIITDNFGDIESYAMTNNNGYYEVLGISTGIYTVTATKIFYETTTIDMLIDQNETLDMSIDPIPSTSSDENDIPANNNFLKNYPNPFNPVTKISFSTLESSKINLSIFNLKGEKVKTLLNDELEPGPHSYIWDGTDTNGKSVASGIYLYKLNTGLNSVSKKMILMK